MRLVVVATLFGVPTSVLAQADSVRGTVPRLTNDAPIGNAVVAWLGHPSGGAATTAEGRFRLASVKGARRLVILAIGFRPDTVDLGEPGPVTELHFTPGTPRRLEIGIRWRPSARP